MERINLNVPEGVKRQKEIESIQREQTPERQARLLELAHVVEALRAPAPRARRRGISR